MASIRITAGMIFVNLWETGKSFVAIMHQELARKGTGYDFGDGHVISYFLSLGLSRVRQRADVHTTYLVFAIGEIRQSYIFWSIN